MEFLCINCNKEVETKVKETEMELVVKGQSIRLKTKVRVCAECGEEIFDEQLESETLRKFYDEYKRRNNLLTSTEIKRIRTQWNLTQTEFAVILGMGEKTITRYENGAIQELVHDNLIRLSQSIENFKQLWNLRKQSLSTKTQNKIESMLAKLPTISYYQATSIMHNPTYSIGGGQNARTKCTA